MTEFSVFMPLQGITPGNSLFRVIFLKDYKTIWKIKIREMKKKKKPNRPMDKMDRDGENKPQRFC